MLGKKMPWICMKDLFVPRSHNLCQIIVRIIAVDVLKIMEVDFHNGLNQQI